MIILYPHNQRFMLRRAHDVLVMRTCHALACRGHQVWLLMGRTAADPAAIVRHYGLEPHPNLHLVQLPVLRLKTRWLSLSWHGVFNFFCRRKLEKLMTCLNPDLVYLSEIKLGEKLLAWRRLRALPVAYEVHGLAAPGYEKSDSREQRVFSGVTALITTTASLRSVMERLYSNLPPCHLVPLAADPGKIAPFEPPGDNVSWRLCYIGQLYPLQGVDILIRALALLPLAVTLEIVGGRDDHLQVLQSLAHAEGVAERVTFHGFVAPGAVSAHAARAHIFVMPSRADGKMSYVAHTKLYEYLAWGRPVVAADLEVLREDLIDGVNGMLFAPGDPEALAQALRRVMADPENASRMAIRGLEQARNFTWERRAERLERCFEEIIHRG
ncbi:MAG: glycosyltransferase family 4 protein [Deltaproteobacteria bacterium]|nr:glycosyltransferase family 4 protein [Deltaproteobacteria bacterium]